METIIDELIDGKWVKHKEIIEEPIEETMIEPTQMDKIEAQVLYTALMTDTLIEEE